MTAYQVFIIDMLSSVLGEKKEHQKRSFWASVPPIWQSARILQL
jgi:hypothetical protein